MHILTKIFIVLVTLLAILLVPLVVVYAHNEDSFKAKFEQAKAQTEATRVQQQQAEARLASVESRLQREVDQLVEENRDLQSSSDTKTAEIRRLESQVAQGDSLKAETLAQLAVLSSSLEASQQLNESLIGELRTIRAGLLASERQNVELDEALREVSSQLEVAVAARRAIAEELQRLKDEHAQAMSDLATAVAMGFRPEDAEVAIGVIPDRDLDATIISVRRGADQTLAEIDAGSRDGVKEGWTMQIGHGGTFKGNLQIISVELNRATGIVTLEDPDGSRGRVEVGHRAQVRKGRN